MYDVISIGAATVDIFIRSPQFVVKKDEQFDTGKALCIAYSSKNEISESLMASGGGATNSSVAFSRLGLNTACVSLAGHDDFYGLISKDLAAENVHNLISHPPSEKTDFSVILVTQDGARSILTNRGSSTLSEDDIDWSQVSQSKWFHISSLEGNLDLLEKLVGLAHESGIKISLNPGNRELKNRRRLLPLLPYVDFLLLNTVESEMLLEAKFDKHFSLQKIISLGPKIAAVTNGRNGAYIANLTDCYYSPIINTTPVDETGAGDSFGSAFVAALIYGHNIETALNWAVTNSASVVSYLGAKPGLLTYKQILG